jgi:hypothetical protein
MSRHTPRHRRWSKIGPAEYTWACTTVRVQRGAWYAWVSYQQWITDSPVGSPELRAQCDRLGPFKRARNAMLAAEEHVRWVRRRPGVEIQPESP